jgi:membrane associated rhomboid family serine protease
MGLSLGAGAPALVRRKTGWRTAQTIAIWVFGLLAALLSGAAIVAAVAYDGSVFLGASAGIWGIRLSPTLVLEAWLQNQNRGRVA